MKSIRKKAAALFMALIIVFGISTAEMPCGVAFAETAASSVSETAQQDGEAEEDRPYWLLVVAIFFFISVTTGVVAVAIYSKKSTKKPENEKTEDKNNK